MYNVLIVDDETIILSGIKFLIDWEKNDCCITDTARNGKDALEKINECPPDIVLCDINMPVMDGIQLLQKMNETNPTMVFIMLTNLQEFHLAQEALRYRAADYLLKNQLDEATLEAALAKAKKEFDQRSSVYRSDKLRYYDGVKQRELIQNACLELLFSPDASAREHAAGILAEHRMLDGYGILYIPLNFAGLPESRRLTNESKASLTAWEKELATRLADNLFGKKYLDIPTGQNDCLTIFIWGQRENWEQNISLFSSKIASASENITQILPVVCATPCFFGPGQLPACRNAYFSRIETFYLNEDTSAASLQTNPGFEPLGLTGIGSQLEAELNSKNLTGCILLLDKAIFRLQNTRHQKSQAIWLCNELYRSAAKALAPDPSDTGGYAEIKALMTRRQVIAWIEHLKKYLSEMLGDRAMLKSEPVEKARQYVLDHIEEHISLQDVANEVCISAGYLSTLFKKQYNQSFVSFINQAKIDRACELIAEQKYLISEISYRLGFENAYYFTKVFRRCTGMTPSEWEKKHVIDPDADLH